MAERTSVALRPRDLVRVGLTVTARTGTDMAETANGWLWRCYRLGTNVVVERSIDAGHTWAAVTVGTSPVAVPTLAVDRRDRLWCWYGDLTTAYAVVSDDYGDSWAAFTQHLGGGPRMAVGIEDSYVVIHDGLSTLGVFRTVDGGANLQAVHGIDCPAQVASLEFDRRGVLHLLYKDGDDVIHHVRADDPKIGEFSDPVAWAEGRFQTFAIGTEYGIFARWSGGLLHLHRTNETFDALTGSVAVPTGTFTPGYTGIWIDRRGQHWLTPKPAAQPVTSIWSGSLVGWSTP